MRRNKTVDSDTTTKRDSRSKSSYSKGRKGKQNRKEDVVTKRDLTLPQKDKEYNKLEYYIRDSRILDQASQLSFQNFIGATPIDNYEIPSIMRFYMNPTPGLTYQGSNPALIHPKRAGINMAAVKLFNSLSMSSGRNMQYAPQDVGTMILAMGQLYALNSYLRRLFGCVKLWNNYNRMFPRAIIEAMGIDYIDFVTNYADYRTRINSLIATVNQLPLLLNDGYLEKSFTQYEYLFVDDESPLAQTYVYLPRTTWILDETILQQGTVLKTTEVCKFQRTRTLSDLITKVLAPMIDAMVESSTMNLVYADLLNLATKVGNIKFTTLPFIEDGIATMPIHNYEALLHIHNMTILGADPSLSTATHRLTPNNDVYPDPDNNCLLYNPGYAHHNTVSWKVPELVVIDSPEPNPDAGTRIEMTRYKATYTNNQETIDGVTYRIYVIVPDYVCVRADVISNDVSTPQEFESFPENSSYNTNSWKYTSKISQFDWHPVITPFEFIGGKLNQVFGDLNYYTTVDRAYLERLNQVIYLGLFEFN